MAISAAAGDPGLAGVTELKILELLRNETASGVYLQVMQLTVTQKQGATSTVHQLRT